MCKKRRKGSFHTYINWITLKEKEFCLPYYRKDLVKIQPRFKGNRKFASWKIQFFELKPKSSIVAITDGDISMIQKGKGFDNISITKNPKLDFKYEIIIY